MKKKILSLLLAAVMVAAMIVAIPVSATEYPVANVAAVADQTAAKPGDSFTVDFVITVDETVWGFFLPISFDTTRLELTEWTKNADEFGGSTTDAALKKLTGYDNYTGTADATAGQYGVNAADGVVLCTATFTVKEDAPAGPAYISSMNYLPELKRSCYQPNAENYVALTHTATYVNIVDSAYGAGGVGSNGFFYSFADEDGEEAAVGGKAPVAASVMGYEGTSTAVTIPTYVPAMLWSDAAEDYVPALDSDENPIMVPVTSIGSQAFQNMGIEYAFIPETVELIDELAFQQDPDLATVYILNGDCEIADNAFGYNVKTSYSSNKGKAASWANMDITIYTVAGSAVTEFSAYNSKVSCSFESIFPTVVTVGDMVLSFALESNETTAPSADILPGKKVLTWKVNETTYLPGDEVTLNAGDAFEAGAVVEAPASVNGASIRYADTAADTGLRFQAKLAKADLTTLQTLGTVSVGMLIAPAKYVEAAGCFTKEALGAWAISKEAKAEDAYLDFDLDGCLTSDDTYYYMAASLNNITDSTIAKNIEFACVCYATVETADGTITIYGDYNPSTKRDLKSVALAAYAEVEEGAQKIALGELLAKFN